MQWFNRFPLILLLKEVLIRSIAENERSLVVLAAVRTRSRFASLVTSGNNIFWLSLFPKFNSDTSSFVIDILLLCKKGEN